MRKQGTVTSSHRCRCGAICQFCCVQVFQTTDLPMKAPSTDKAHVSKMRRISEAEAAGWYAGKDFSFDWTSWHFPNWFNLLNDHRKRKMRVLEIGSWEGRSAIFFLNY